MKRTDPLTEELENRWYELSRLAIAETKRRYPPKYDKPEDYIKAAERGDAEAQYRLGNVYLRGKAVERNLSEAGRWNRRAALQGHPTAQFRLGLAYKSGEGAWYDDAEGTKWIRAAAEQGYAEAQHYLGLMYESYDPAAALMWYKKAAEHGENYGQLHEIQYRLGRMYERDNNFAEAILWYRESAAVTQFNGNPNALYHLGLLYESGKGVPRDDAEAIELYRKAANQRQPDAQYILGCKHQSGNGVALDYVEAYKWVALAAMMFLILADSEKCDAAIDKRDQIATQMTPQQIDAALLIAHKWQEERNLLVGQKPPPTLKLVEGG